MSVVFPASVHSPDVTAIVNTSDPPLTPRDLWPHNGASGGAPIAQLSPDWDPAFHGSVHTATLAVCTVLVIFIVVLGTFGNGLVLLSALQCRKLRSNFEVLVCSLAAADFIVSACLAPTFLYLLFSGPPSDPGFCVGFVFASAACGLASLLTLVAIAVHRQARVKGRAKGSLTCAQTAGILGAVYAISLGSAASGSLHVLLAWDDTASSCRALLHTADLTRNNVVLFFVSPTVIISFIVVVASYVVIARAVKLQTHLRVKSIQPILRDPLYRESPKSDTHSILDGDDDPRRGCSVAGVAAMFRRTEVLQHCSCCSCQSALEKENKAVTMCFVVIVIIALSWTPLIASHLVELFTGDSIILYQVKLCGIALVFLNSALDPYMYAQNNERESNKKYSRFFWDVLRCEFHFPSKQRIKTLSNQNPLMVKSLRGGSYFGPDCAKLSTPKRNQNTSLFKAVVTHSFISENKTHHKHSSKKPSPKHNNRNSYSSNILMFGNANLRIQTNKLWKPEVGPDDNREHVCPEPKGRAAILSSHCAVLSPEEQSLIDSFKNANQSNTYEKITATNLLTIV